MNHDFLIELNKAQRDCVENIDGTSVIVAGAGSGKTRVITYRVAYLLGLGVDPFKILVLTFTNKAAKEMKERTVRLVGDDAKNIWMGTFHSIFARILRIEAEHFGFTRNFTIYDTDDSKSLLKTIIKKDLGLSEDNYKVNTIANKISMAKNNLITAKEYNENEEITRINIAAKRPLTGEIYKRYAKRCINANAMDFDDLLLYTCLLFQNKPEILFKYQNKFEYIMVDEFQDTNFVQYIITKLLSSVHRNLCVVGDDAQSIYSFRGADINNILNFQEDNEDTKVFKLEQNYRSTHTIVEASNNVIRNNKNQIQKKVVAVQDGDEKIHLIKSHTDNEEGYLVVQEILSRQSMGLKFKDFAVLYRINALSRSFEEALRKSQIPYKIFGGTSFYQRKEIKDVLAYLRLSINLKDEEALKRIINYPARGIGNTTLDRIIVAANENNISLWEVVDRPELYLPQNNTCKTIKDFSTMLRSFQVVAMNEDAFTAAEHISKHCKILEKLRDDESVEAMTKVENIKELLSSIKEFTDSKGEVVGADDEGVEKNLASFLQQISLMTNADEKVDTEDYITLMTVHNAKGLEFENVFVVGLEEGMFPYQRSMNSKEELEEERRLFYVAITRAKKRLFLSFSNSRYRMGNRFNCSQSRFINEIGGEHIIQKNLRPPSNQFLTDTKSVKSLLTKMVQNKPTYSRPVSSPYKHTLSKNYKPVESSEIKKAQKVEHERFGFGKVLEIEGTYPNLKAIVDFEKNGQKKLMLKYAKLSIVQD